MATYRLDIPNMQMTRALYGDYLNAIHRQRKALKDLGTLERNFTLITADSAKANDLPPEIRFRAGDYCLFETLPGPRALHFTAGDGHCTDVLSLPFLYFWTYRGSLSKVFCRTKPLLTLDDMLHKLPFSHIDPNGAICIGQGGHYPYPRNTPLHVYRACMADFLFTRFLRKVYGSAIQNSPLKSYLTIPRWVRHTQEEPFFGLDIPYVPYMTVRELIQEHYDYHDLSAKTYRDSLEEYTRVVQHWKSKFGRPGDE